MFDEANTDNMDHMLLEILVHGQSTKVTRMKWTQTLWKPEKDSIKTLCFHLMYKCVCVCVCVQMSLIDFNQ